MNILTEQDLKRIVPAAFANGPSHKASERYAFIPTYPLIEQIRQRGWEPVRAHQSTRTQDKEHAIHSISFREPGVKMPEVGDVFPELTLINSHDLSKRWNMLAGFFRLACLNGLVSSIGNEIQDSRIHLDDANIDIDIAIDKALINLGSAGTSVREWQQVELPWAVRQEFARDAIIIKNGGDTIWSKHFQPHEFLRRRREADQGNDLWTIFNVVQENITKGGVMGVTRETRPITQVRSLVKINQDLWQLAEKYGKLHGRN